MLEGAKSIGAGAATIALAGAAVGIGNVLSSSINSVARNPSLAKQLFGYAILGFALTEAIASFALMMAFLISSVFRSFHKASTSFFPALVKSNRGWDAVLKQKNGDKGAAKVKFKKKSGIGSQVRRKEASPRKCSSPKFLCRWG
uniref:ATP synthase subunit 9, mitochondrial n=3 Tax=Asclepiadoideae TaxID=167484 RepID=A0A8F7CJV4_9GENT|nr:Atp9 [Hoya lithophytica]